MVVSSEAAWQALLNTNWNMQKVIKMTLGDQTGLPWARDCPKLVTESKQAVDLWNSKQAWKKEQIVLAILKTGKKS